MTRPIMEVSGRPHNYNTQSDTEPEDKQDRQALLKVKYCPQVVAVSCTQKNTKKTCDLDRRLMTLKFNRVIEVVEVHVHEKFHQAKCSGS